MPAARHHLRAPLKVTLQLVVWDIGRGNRLALDPRHQGAGRLHGRYAARPTTAPSSSTAPSASSSARCTARRACSSTTTGQDAQLRQATCSPPRIIPYRGSGSTSSSTPGPIHVRIDRRRKLPVTTLLLALGNDATAASEIGGTKNQALDPQGPACRRRSGGVLARSPSSATRMAGTPHSSRSTP